MLDRTVWILMTGLFAVSMACGGGQKCREGQDIHDEINHLVATGGGDTFALTELATFEWERVFVFGAYTPITHIEKSTGLSYKPTWWQDYHVPEARNLLVFTSDVGPICYVEIPNEQAGAEWIFSDSAYRHQGISREEATFFIDRSGKLPVLNP